MAVKFVTLTDIKTYLGVSGSTEDDALTEYENQVADLLEATTRRALEEAERTEAFVFSWNQPRVIVLRARPVTEIASVLDANGDELTEDGYDEDYVSDTERGLITLLNYQSRVTVTYTGGYTTATFPKDLKSVVLGKIAELRSASRTSPLARLRSEAIDGVGSMTYFSGGNSPAPFGAWQSIVDAHTELVV